MCVIRHEIPFFLHTCGSYSVQNALSGIGSLIRTVFELGFYFRRTKNYYVKLPWNCSLNIFSQPFLLVLFCIKAEKDRQCRSFS